MSGITAKESLWKFNWPQSKYLQIDRFLRGNEDESLCIWSTSRGTELLVADWRIVTRRHFDPKMASGEAAILPCWSIAALEGTFSLAHADRSIKFMRGQASPRNRFSHNDVVRDLYALDNESFVSVGNDGTVKVWNISDGTEIQSILRSSFLHLRSHLEWLGPSCHFRRGRNRQNLENGGEKAAGRGNYQRVPMMSSWSALFLDEATLIIGGSSGTLYKFTSNGSANADLTETFHCGNGCLWCCS